MKGLQITEVKNITQGQAQALGFKKLDIIVEVDGSSVSTNSDFSTLINNLKASKKTEVQLVLVRDNEQLTFTFDPSKPLGVSLYPYKKTEPGNTDNLVNMTQIAPNQTTTPFASMLLTWFAYGALLMGIISALYFYPSGYRAPSLAYTMSASSLFLGTFNFALLFGAAKVIEYLSQIEINTRKSCNNKQGDIV